MINKIFKTAIVFFFIYNVQLKGWPSLLSSRKIVFFIMLLYYVYKHDGQMKIRIFKDRNTVDTSICKIFNMAIFAILYVIIISLIQTILGTSMQGNTQLQRQIYFLIFGPISWFLAKDMFDDTEKFMSSLFWATLIQCIIVILEFHVFSFAQILNDVFEIDAHITYMIRHRAAGIGAGDSLLAINIFLGAVSCAYFLINSKNYIFYMASYIVIMYATMRSGTLGMIFCASLLFGTAVYCLVRNRVLRNFEINCFILLGGLCIGILFPEVIMELFESDIIIKFRSIFAEGVLNNETAKTLITQDVASISVETLLGTGLYRGMTVSGIINMSDTGYLQNYFGLGLIVTIIFYYTIYSCMYKNIKKLKDPVIKFIMGYFFLAIMVAEAKEPYIYHHGELFVFFMIVYMEYKNNYKLIEEDSHVYTRIRA